MKILLGCLMAMLLTACSGNRVVNYDVGEKPDDFPVLKAVGYAVIDIQPGPSQSEKMLQAIRASKMDAYRELAEQLNGQQVRGQSSQDLTQTSTPWMCRWRAWCAVHGWWRPIPAATPMPPSWSSTPATSIT
jgi:hypothetical protein